MIEYVPGKIEPVCLPDNTTIAADYTDKCWAAGWGHTKYMGRISPVLNEVDLPIIPGMRSFTQIELSSTDHRQYLNQIPLAQTV